jgi:hypothetical protein
VHLRGEPKKFNIARGESKGKKITGGKIKLAHIIGSINLFTLQIFMKLFVGAYEHNL